MKTARWLSRRFPAFIVRLRSPRSGGGLASPASNTPTPPIVKEEVPTLQANAPPADEPASEEPTAAVEPSNPPQPQTRCRRAL